MITLNEYIIEGKRTTSSNSERLKALENWLKGKKYPDYVNTLNKMLEDPKAKTLLVDGFGGELGDIKFVYSPKLIKPSRLIPTQKEIDLNKSIRHGLTKASNIDEHFKDEIIINNMPLVTFRGNYVIDGHHRWAEAISFNPEGKMLCFDYDADISPIQMLKAVQGSIAAVLAETPEEDRIPSSKTKDQNIFDDSWDEKKIRKYIESTITEDVVDKFIEYTDCESEDETINYIVDNIISMKANNHPTVDSPNRGEMPQTDKGGKNKKDRESSLPTTKGSALNKMKDGKFTKKIL